MRSTAKVLFIGSKALGLACLKALHQVSPTLNYAVVTYDDQCDSRSRLTDYAEFCEVFGFSLHVLKKPAQLDAVVQGFQPEICFVSGWYWILPKKMLDRVPRGFLGVHPSLLPKYRGAAPLVWALIHGETEVGATLFTFTDETDSGDIWWQVIVAVEPNDSINLILQRLEDAVVEQLRQSWEAILNGKLVARTQDSAKATYFGVRKPSDGEINWSWSAEKIHDFIRAQSKPYPGAFTYLDGEKLNIWSARVINSNASLPPGRGIVFGERILIQCGECTSISIGEISYLSLEGTAKEVLQTHVNSSPLVFS